MRLQQHPHRVFLGVSAVALAYVFFRSGLSNLSPNQVTAVKTPLTNAQAKTLLSAALTNAFGRAPTSGELSMVMAQSALETGHWKSIFNYNFGNSVGSTSNAWFALKGTPGYHYKAFSSASEGSQYFVNLLKKTFTKAWSLLGSGNPAAFAQALHDQGYFESPVEQYAAGLTSLYATV